MPGTEFIDQLRTELPRLLREHPEVRHEVLGLIMEAVPSRQEFATVLEEIRISREESNRRFEAMDRRFEAMDRRFEAVDRRFEELRNDMNKRFEAMDRRFEAVDRRFEEMRSEMTQRFDSMDRRIGDLMIGMSSLGNRVGHGLEGMLKGAVEEFAGERFPHAERLVLRDDSGEVFGVEGAEVEFDLYAHNGNAYLVEVKSHVKTTDVFFFHKKTKFAEGRLGRTAIPLILALSMDPRAEQRMRELGIRYRVGGASWTGPLPQ